VGGLLLAIVIAPGAMVVLLGLELLSPTLLCCWSATCVARVPRRCCSRVGGCEGTVAPSVTTGMVRSKR
jgi:hypothetical protein